MWWATFFGMYHQATSSVGENEYMSILYIIPAVFKAAKNSLTLYSTLDHGVRGNT